MNIGLIDVDSYHFPNYALMKISSYHKAKGDNVYWYEPFDEITTDKIYASKIFNFTPEYGYYPKSVEVIKGGTGYDIKGKLPEEIENCLPDYSIYPKYDYGVGFLTRGCRNKCSWCIVPDKEGLPSAYHDIERIASNTPSKNIVLLDNNVLATEYGIEQLKKIGSMDIKVDFCSGFESRLITDEIAEILAKIKWFKPLRMAMDVDSSIPSVEKATEILRKHGVSPKEYFCYVLAKENEMESNLRRILKCKELGLKPYCQPYLDWKNYKQPCRELKQLQRWCNQKVIFNSCTWEEYKNKDFKNDDSDTLFLL